MTGCISSLLYTGMLSSNLMGDVQEFIVKVNLSTGCEKQHLKNLHFISKDVFS
jgi:hypothetical protein